jgi:NAD(P)-dependent dehydrogenase (short-subunit alcohol dehydrogenase family)
MESVRNAARIFSQTYPKLDALFNCAGVLIPRRRITKDGLEWMFGVNYLSHFLLTNLLYPSLRKAGHSRVITVSGSGHKRSWTEGPRKGALDFRDLQGERRFSIQKAAKQAVFARIVMSYELARRWGEKGIECCTLCPGLTRTDMMHRWPAVVRAIVRLRYWFERALDIEQAGANIAGLYDTSAIVNGKYFETRKKKLIEAKSLPGTYDREIAVRLWEESERLVGQRFQ